MNQPEFQRQLDRLISVYGDRAYPQERAMLLWKDVNKLDIGWFEKTVDNLIANTRQAPLHNDFAPFISLERERVWKIEKDREVIRDASATYSCEFCRDRGVYICVLNGNRAVPYGFRCHCAKGHADPRKQIPQYKQDHAKQGYRYYDVEEDRRARA